MNRSTTLAILALIVSSLLSCTSNTNISGSTKEGSAKQGATGDPQIMPANDMPTTNSNGDTQDLNSEAVSVPSSIVGAYLVCAIQEATDKVEVKVGCGFHDASNKRVNIRDIAASDRFFLVGTQPEGVLVTTLAGDAANDVYFSFTGAKFDILKEAAFSAVYQVELKGSANGEADKVIGGKGTTIATPPAPRWVRENSSDANANQLCDDGEICIYQGNGLMWYKDLGVPKNYGDASSFCDSFTDTFSDWRLPNESELKMAFEKDIVEVANILNLVDEAYFALATNGTTGVNPLSGAAIQFPTGELHRSLCVRAF